MHRSDLPVTAVWGSGAALILLGVFNFAASQIQLIGVGTFISTSIGLYKFFSDRKFAKRNATNALIVRLQPKVYDPLYTWALNLKRILGNQLDMGFKDAAEPPPDLSAVQDFRSIVGNSLKSALNALTQRAREHEQRRRQLQGDYKVKVETLVKKVNPQWNANDVRVLFYRGGSLTPFAEDYVTTILNRYGIGSVTGWISTSSSIILGLAGNPQQLGVPCPTTFLPALLQMDDLASFSDFQAAREVLIREIGALVAQLDSIGAKGETDWNFSLFSS